MAHGDAALKSVRQGARGDLAKLETTERPGIVEMNIKPDPATLGDAEDRLEMSGDVIVDPRGIEAADEIGAVANGLIEQVLHAGIGEDAALRKGDDLDVDEVPRGLAHAQQRMQSRQADF